VTEISSFIQHFPLVNPALNYEVRNVKFPHSELKKLSVKFYHIFFSLISQKTAESKTPIC